MRAEQPSTSAVVENATGSARHGRGVAEHFNERKREDDMSAARVQEVATD
jgi:hypothetical protein